MDQTQVLAPRTGMQARGPVGAPPAAPRTGPDLLLIAEGREYRFRHPAQVTIGRRTDSTVVLTDPACSRQHGQVSAVPGGWVYTNASGEGSFDDGRRVTSMRFDDRVVLRLGHPVAGPELTLVPILSAAEEEKRIARRRLNRRLAIAGAAAAALVLVLGIVAAGIAISNRGDDTTAGGGDGSSGSTASGELSPQALESAKAATVKISAESYPLADPSQAFAYGGSGSILRDDGLILTNAHVAAPESPGLAEKYGPDSLIANPDYVLISLTDGATDTSAPAEYRARVVAADGYLDVAVVQIYADVDGNELTGDLDLPTVPVGSSDDLRAGDDVTVLGFPGVAGSGDSITVTTGVISTVLDDPELGPKAELDTDARIAPGNSGGMAVDNSGELIGIPTSLYFDQSSPVTSGRIRSIDAVADLIEEAEQATS
ncbi:trypsin-like peptidase domain-containing protein [Nocardioides sambongensis]|uniref:trypsin-like peptidase domain-containing protein n=1 Tax=Nocardioides sambongensis TaxID=2589074 RepID=UPI00112B0E2E|nr:trypsin-like peptidase domain-containing protein [Nocardioides sambongensis]